MGTQYAINLADGPTNCRTCQDIIEMGRPRLGIRKEGTEYKYYHLGCFPAIVPTDLDITRLPGFHELSKKDKDAILQSGRDTDIRGDGTPSLIRGDDFIGKADKQAECRSCSEYILIDQVYVRHYEKAGKHLYCLGYHLVCWLKHGPRPPNKPLSSYVGFNQLSKNLQDKVLGACSESPRDMREDPSSPAQMDKPTKRTPPKQCLASTKHGTQCRWNTNSRHCVATPLLKRRRYTCFVHKDTSISPGKIREYEQERRVDFGVKLLQYERNEDKKKRARASPN